MSILFNLSGTTSQLQSEIFPPLNVSDGNYEIGLIYFMGNNTVYNIHEKNNSFRVLFAYNYRLYGADCSLSPGMYDFELITREFIAEIKEAFKIFQKDLKLTADEKTKYDNLVQHIEFTSDQLTHKWVLEIPEDDTRAIYVDMKVKNSIAPLLGLQLSTLPDLINSTKKQFTHILVNHISLNTVRVLNIHCNLTGNSYINGVPSHLLYSIPLSKAPGYQIVEAPKDVVFLPVTDTLIDTVEIRITDQYNTLLDFKGDPIVIVLELRKK